MASLAGISRIAERAVSEMPEAYRPLRVETREVTDWQGEPSLRVTLVLAKAAFARADLGRSLSDAGLRVRERLVAEGELRFPVVEFSVSSDAGA